MSLLLGRPLQEGLEPGILEHDADGPRESGTGPGRHVEGDNLPLVDEIPERRKLLKNGDARWEAATRRVVSLQLFARLRIAVSLLIRTRRGTEGPGDVRQVEQGQEDAQALNNGRPELAVELHPVEAVPSFHTLDDGLPIREDALPLGRLGLEPVRQEVVYEVLVVGGPHDAQW